MKQDVFAAIQVAVFLFGVAWFEGTFETPQPPKMVPQYDRPHHVTQHLDSAHDELLNLTMPQASMPIGHRYVHAEPQNYSSRFTQVDQWTLGTNPTLMLHMAARMMPVVYEPPRIHHPDHGPELAGAPILSGDLHGAIPSPGPGVGPSARHQFRNLVRDTSLRT